MKIDKEFVVDTDICIHYDKIVQHPIALWNFQ